MRTKIIKIGNSKGIMLSKQLINQYELGSEVEIIPEKDGIFIKPVRSQPRANWDDQFKMAMEKGQLPEGELLEGFDNEFDKTEWKW
jgi:antitoxin MazE